MSLYLSLGSATSALGPPYESPVEMGSSFRLANATHQKDHGRRASIYTRGDRQSGFRPSSEQSTLTRDIALAKMRALTLTKSNSDSSEVVLTGREGCSARPSPLRMDTTTSSLQGAASRVSSFAGLGDTDFDDQYDDLIQPDTDPVFGIWRTVDPFGQPPPIRQSNEDMHPELEDLLDQESPRTKRTPQRDLVMRDTIIDKNGRVRRRKDSGKVQAKPIVDWIDDVNRCVAEADDAFGEEGASAVRTPSPTSRAVFWCGDEEDEDEDEDEGEADEESGWPIEGHGGKRNRSVPFW